MKSHILCSLLFVGSAISIGPSFDQNPTNGLATRSHIEQRKFDLLEANERHNEKRKTRVEGVDNGRQIIEPREPHPAENNGNNSPRKKRKANEHKSIELQLSQLQISKDQAKSHGGTSQHPQGGSNEVGPSNLHRKSSGSSHKSTGSDKTTAQGTQGLHLQPPKQIGQESDPIREGRKTPSHGSPHSRSRQGSSSYGSPRSRGSSRGSRRGENTPHQPPQQGGPPTEQGAVMGRPLPHLRRPSPDHGAACVQGAASGVNCIGASLATAGGLLLRYPAYSPYVTGCTLGTGLGVMAAGECIKAGHRAHQLGWIHKINDLMG